MGDSKDSKDITVDTVSISQCSTKCTDQQGINGEPTTSVKPAGKKRSLFKREEKEPVPEWKLEQERKFKEWNKSRDKQRSTAGFYTDFYKPKGGKNKGFWVWWL